jgi:hypothetical protein
MSRQEDDDGEIPEAVHVIIASRREVCINETGGDG